MSFFSNFWQGATFVGKGCHAFYSDWKSWKYTIPPFLGVALVYGLLYWGVHLLCQNCAESIATWETVLPNWLHWLTGVAQSVALTFITLCAVVLAAFSLSTVYTFFGNFFFDYLVEYFVKKRYNYPPVANTLKRILSFAMASCLWGILSAVYFLFFFLLSLCIPMLGKVIFVLAMGYNFGITYMLSVNYCHGKSLRHLIKLARRNFGFTLGFGTIVYLVLCLPFAAIFLLPGIVLGGTMLYHEKLSGGKPELK